MTSASASPGPPPINPRALDDDDRAVYEWQMWLPELGEAGQRRLKGATVLLSRCGGLGGLVAFELAAAGVGRLIIAHGGVLKRSDLHRQLLMTDDHVGKPRIESILRRLRALNPRIRIDGVGENISDANAAGLVAQADVVVDAAPLFSERFAMNREIVRQGRPMVECAVYALEGQITTIIPGRTPCLACLYPDFPTTWKRQFPVIGAVPGTLGCLAAMEAIKLITGMGRPLAGTMLACDLGAMAFRRLRVRRDPACAVCSAVASQAAGNRRAAVDG